jgi:glutamine---fructose-6-phosphate transaminase (isomerizing)
MAERTGVSTTGSTRTFDPKNGFPHYMLKEIYEQAEAVRTTIAACTDARGKISLPEPAIGREAIRSLRKISIAASGSSRHAGLAGEFMLEHMTGLPVEVDFASQYCYRDPVVNAHELAVVISQSGTTADTLAALHEARRKGAKTLAICNVPDTPLTRDADATLLTYAGTETSIAATKSFTTQLTALFLLAAHIAEIHGKSLAAIDVAVRELNKLPEQIQQVLETNQRCLELANLFYKYEDFLFLGRDIDYPIALEGALKLKEVSYIHAEGYPTGEIKHGPTALVDEKLPIVVLNTRDDSDEASCLRFEKSLSNIRELVETGAHVIAVVTSGDTETGELTPHTIAVPDIPVLLQPIVEVVPLQLLSYHIAVLRGRNVDRPRNLSKSVVVE